MTPDEMLTVALKLRKHGARKLELRPDGSMSVEFLGMPTVRSRARQGAQQGDQAQVTLDAIVREPRMTAAEREAYEDRLNEEYIPGGGRL